MFECNTSLVYFIPQKFNSKNMCQQPLSSTSPIYVSKISKLLQNKWKFVNCTLFSTIFFTCSLFWICLTWNNSCLTSNNIITKYKLYTKHTNILPNNTLEHYKRRTSMEVHPKRASWDLLGSQKSPSLYTKFMIDGHLYNLEVDTGSFLTWFRCDYKSYQVTKIM